MMVIDNKYSIDRKLYEKIDAVIEKEIRDGC